MKRHTCLVALAVGFVLAGATAVSAQSEWQVQLLGGVYTPGEGEIQDIYGNTPVLQAALRVPIGRVGRLKLGTTYYGATGDPYWFSTDFSAGEVASLDLAAFDMALEVNAAARYNPQIYLGLGVSYFYGRHEIESFRSYSGSGLGLIMTLSPEFAVSRQISIMLETSLRFGEMKLRRDSERFRFDLSGAALMLGGAYKF